MTVALTVIVAHVKRLPKTSLLFGPGFAIPLLDIRTIAWHCLALHCRLPLGYELSSKASANELLLYMASYLETHFGPPAPASMAHLLDQENQRK